METAAEAGKVQQLGTPDEHHESLWWTEEERNEGCRIGPQTRSKTLKIPDTSGIDVLYPHHHRGRMWGFAEVSGIFSRRFVATVLFYGIQMFWSKRGQMRWRCWRHWRGQDGVGRSNCHSYQAWCLEEKWGASYGRGKSWHNEQELQLSRCAMVRCQRETMPLYRRNMPYCNPL